MIERVLGDAVALVRDDERVGELHPVHVTVRIHPRPTEAIVHVTYEHPVALTLDETAAVHGVGVFLGDALTFIQYIRGGTAYTVTPGTTVRIATDETANGEQRVDRIE